MIDAKDVYTDERFNTDGIRYGFFGRRGGVSLDIYQGLNIGLGSNDMPEHIMENRRRIAAYLDVDTENLLNVYQVHDDVCVQVDTPWVDGERPRADAMATDVPGLALGVLTADCTPVLLHGKKENGKPVIGAAHAGWRGAYAGILGATVKRMEKLGAVSETITACVGPCIQKKSYEVSADFYDQFIKQDEENDRFFSSGQRAGHPHFDLPGYCASRLQQAGIKRVIIQDLDTYALEDKFFSCRRAAHRNESDYGRQMSVVMIQPK